MGVIVGEGSNGTNGTSDSPTRGDVYASSARMLHTTSRDITEWLQFSRGLVIEPVLPRPLLVASQATVPHPFLELQCRTLLAARDGRNWYYPPLLHASARVRATHMILRPVSCWG